MNISVLTSEDSEQEDRPIEPPHVVLLADEVVDRGEGLLPLRPVPHEAVAALRLVLEALRRAARGTLIMHELVAGVEAVTI